MSITLVIEDLVTYFCVLSPSLSIMFECFISRAVQPAMQ